MSNTFPKEAESCSVYNTTSWCWFNFCPGLVWFLLVPVGKAPRETRDFHAVSSLFYLLCFQWAGKVQFASGFQWDAVCWEENAAGFFVQQGGGHGLAVVLQTFLGMGGIPTMISQ